MPDPIRQRYETSIEGFGGYQDHLWASHQSRDALVEVTNAYDSAIDVKDGLDEVDTAERQGLVDSFQHIIIQSDSLVKVFITSRNSMDIVMNMEHIPNIYIKAEDNRDDISNFIYESLLH
ncbi:hypothetical protein K469DRAFT_773689 [Zopfia rhizophila CBS 207.26]|uniref:Nephrocystin 3-like N-terminal domain-containing protein n=1 Tax=Zopfia rhizophila CBS 207.26 TaxID=1314779 RepID=A0A6A6EWX8_9PEZI|nr:hypothetical protein K469DRAFT_773689 [Zopfia rhizophila CBS 207.26]